MAKSVSGEGAGRPNSSESSAIRDHRQTITEHETNTNLYNINNNKIINSFRQQEKY